jgi:hypothetical protein
MRALADLAFMMQASQTSLCFSHGCCLAGALFLDGSLWDFADVHMQNRVLSFQKHACLVQ